jgi:aspartyl aminopeptidase
MDFIILTCVSRISQNTGVRAVDLGMPMLSMHSIREIMGAADLFYAHKLFLIFLTEFRSLDVSLEVSKKSI